MNAAGLLYALIAFGIWGLFPLYWAFLMHVDSIEILVHRMIWAACFMAIIVSVSRQWKQLRHAFTQKRLVAWALLASFLVAWNWGVYIYAVTHGHIVETSFGYYINPLVSVALGVIIFGERLRPMQTAAVLIASCGVLYLIVDHGEIPIIALTLAFSFAGYSVVKKMIPLGPTQGMAFESFLLFLPATAYLLWLASQGQMRFADSYSTSALLMIGGVITAVPLLFFTAAAQRIDLTIIGMSQYITPSLQLAIGVWVFNEPFQTTEKIAFGIVWFAVALYSIEGLWVYQQRKNAKKSG